MYMHIQSGRIVILSGNFHSNGDIFVLDKMMIL